MLCGIVRKKKRNESQGRGEDAICNLFRGGKKAEVGDLAISIRDREGGGATASAPPNLGMQLQYFLHKIKLSTP